MRLSMWMLNDWLHKYHPEPKITGGEQVLRSARVLSNDTVIEKQNVYLARASEFISGEEYRTICVHGKDMILLNTNDLNAVLNDIFDAFDFYNSWADEMSEDIQSGCSIQEMLDQSHPIFQQPIVIYDSGNELIGISSEYPKGSLDEEWDSLLENGTNTLGFLMNIQPILKEQRNFHGIHKFSMEGTPYSSVYRSLFHERSWIGRMILLETDHKLSEGETQLFDYFAQMVERWASLSDKAVQLREETAVFRDLIEDKNVAREEIDHKLQMAGWKREDRKQLIRIEIPLHRSEIARSVFLRIEKTFANAYVIYSQDVIFLLRNMEFPDERNLEEKLKLLLEQSDLCAVASYPFTDVYALSDHNEQCSLTYHYIPRQKGILYDCRDYALECIHSFIHTAVPAILQHPALQILQKQDADNSGELYQTLYIYLRNCCNMARTARILHLHRNSLLYRLNQIRELTGIDFDSEDCREHLLISYYIGLR